MSNEPSASPTASESVPASCLSLNGQGLKSLVEAGMTWLKTNQQIVNALNVFPVPDGDTGTNMLLTMQAAYSEIAQSGENNIGKMAHAVAQGALMGARGNSGVILSQLWRGFARALDSLDEMDADLFVRALAEARNTAYKGVVRPVEGTILTVAKDSAAGVEEARAGSNDLAVLLEIVVAKADLSVQHTPELLPILKQAGVVDSGGKGLFYILEGMLRYLKGLSLETSVTVQSLASMANLDQAAENIEPGQEVEVVIDFRPFKDLDLESFYTALSDIGTSIQVGEGDGMYRMHIHTTHERRFEPIDYVMSLGTWSKIAMENLVAQMEEQGSAAKESQHLQLNSIEPGQVAVVAISPGMGISKVFASLGAAAIVQGGQTMNPSTEEILSAFENLPTDRIIILPNNKNIILAAQNAASVTVKKVAVIPSRSIPQGITALFRYSPDASFDGLVEEMNDALNDVSSGEITVATRTVEINGVDVHEGEVIALLDGKLVASAHTLDDACLKLLQEANTDKRELITLFTGENVQKNEINRISDLIHSRYPGHEIEIKEGGQPHYHFIIAIE
jgi:uncharacterized protein